MLKQEYQEWIGQVKPSAALRERTAKRMAELGKDRVSQPCGKRRLAVSVLACVLAAALTVGAGAAGFLKPVADLFAPVFGGEESQLELIERMGTSLGISDTRNGVTVTAEAMLNDGRNVAVLYSVSRESGEPLIPAGAPENGRLLFCSKGIDGGGWTYQRRFGEFIEYAPGALSAGYMEYYTAPDVPADRIPVYMGDLEYRCGDGAQAVELVEKSHGPDSNEDFWQFDLPVSAGSCPVLELSEKNREFKANGLDLAVTGVRVSPISVKVSYELQNREIADESAIDEALVKGLTENMSLVLRKKDGTELDLSAFSDEFGNVNPTAVWEYSAENKTVYGICGSSLNEIVPIEEMDCVIFNGMEYPAVS